MTIMFAVMVSTENSLNEMTWKNPCNYINYDENQMVNEDQTTANYYESHIIFQDNIQDKLLKLRCLPTRINRNTDLRLFDNEVNMRNLTVLRVTLSPIGFSDRMYDTMEGMIDDLEELTNDLNNLRILGTVKINWLTKLQIYVALSEIFNTWIERSDFPFNNRPLMKGTTEFKYITKLLLCELHQFF